jgi:hypothetical protein
VVLRSSSSLATARALVLAVRKRSIPIAAKASKQAFQQQYYLKHRADILATRKLYHAKHSALQACVKQAASHVVDSFGIQMKSLTRSLKEFHDANLSGMQDVSAKLGYMLRDTKTLPELQADKAQLDARIAKMKTDARLAQLAAGERPAKKPRKLVEISEPMIGALVRLWDYMSAEVLCRIDPSEHNAQQLHHVATQMDPSMLERVRVRQRCMASWELDRQTLFCLSLFQDNRGVLSPELLTWWILGQTALTSPDELSQLSRLTWPYTADAFIEQWQGKDAPTKPWMRTGSLPLMMKYKQARKREDWLVLVGRFVEDVAEKSQDLLNMLSGGAEPMAAFKHHFPRMPSLRQLQVIRLLNVWRDNGCDRWTVLGTGGLAGLSIIYGPGKPNPAQRLPELSQVLRERASISLESIGIKQGNYMTIQHLLCEFQKIMSDGHTGTKYVSSGADGEQSWRVLCSKVTPLLCEYTNRQ